MSKMSRKYFLIFVFAVSAVFILARLGPTRSGSSAASSLCPNTTNQVSRKTSIFGAFGQLFEYDRSSSVIFIGGVARSGSNLMRSILNEHPDVSCRGETIILGKVLQMRLQWFKSQKESMRLAEAGMSNEVLESAFASLVLEVLARISEPSPRLCSKDLAILKFSSYLKKLFPKSKFLLMIRDARSTVHSMMTNKLTSPGYDLKSCRTSLSAWNNETSTMISQCDELGSESCLKVAYEQLVLHPGEWLPKIFRFLELTPDDKLVHQIIKPDSLNRWVGQIPQDCLEDLDKLAPMMKTLGFNS